MASPEKIAWSIDFLTAIFGGGKADRESRIAAYAMSLADISDEALQTATVRAGAECLFFPPPARLREILGAPVGERLLSEVACAALQKCREIIARGRYGNYDLSDDPALATTIRELGGIGHLCSMDSEQFNSFFPKRFVEKYIEVSRRVDKSADPILRGQAGETKTYKIFCQYANKTKLLT